MARGKSKNNYDVSYYKPLSCCKKGTKLVGYKTIYGDGYNVHTNTRPIAYSTRATQQWLHVLHYESSSWVEMLNKANGSTGEYLNDPEATKVIQAYIDCNCPYDDMRFE